MRSSLSAAAVFLSALQLVSAQTSTDCDPTKKTCPANPGLGGTHETDFTGPKDALWTYADGTTINYDSKLGAVFSIGQALQAPTVAFSKYIMFGKVTVVMRAAPGAGIVSSFILESADLDEIDWEWIGSVPSDAQSNFFGKGNHTTYDRGAHHAMSAAVTDFHTYEIDWNKDAIKWSIDGNLVRTVPYSDPLALGGQNYPQTPMLVKMGSWVGCASAAAAADPKTQGTCEWAGGPADFSQTSNMYVQKVTIQDYGCGGDYTYSDMSGSYQSIKSSGTCNGQANTVVSSVASVAAVTGVATGTAISQGSSVSTSVSTSASSKSSESSKAGTTSANGQSGSNSTTLASVSSTGKASPTPTGTGSTGTGSSSSGKPSATQPSSAGTKPAHKYGYLDISVIALGLGLGYFIM